LSMYVKLHPTATATDHAVRRWRDWRRHGRRLPIFLVPTLMLIHVQIAAFAGQEASPWTILLHPTDFIVGDALKQLHTRHTWASEFDDGSGAFESAVRRKAVAISAPQCRMDYLILKIPSYYPENPKQASVKERRAVYDTLVALQASGSGNVTARLEAPPGTARMGTSGIELTACNLYFALPLSVQASRP
jgi:hypothetical protein